MSLEAHLLKVAIDKLENLESMMGEMGVSIKEAARMKKKNEATIRRWIYNGKLPSRKEGGQYRIKLSDLNQM